MKKKEKLKLEVGLFCSGAETRALESLTPFQGAFKTLSPENYKRLRQNLLQIGIRSAFTVFEKNKKTFLLDGHQRAEALKRMKTEGVAIPARLPVSVVKVKDEAEARRIVMSLASTYGEVTADYLVTFAEDAGLQLKDISESYNFPDFDIDALLRSKGAEMMAAGGEGGGVYSKKLDTPVYTPKGDKPEIHTLIDHKKTDELFEKIEKAKLPAAEAEFLRKAATRHLVFDYHQIAEFYCHAPKKVQELMEDSGLVIIDFKKAIEKGYVVLSKEIEGIYKKSYGAGDEE